MESEIVISGISGRFPESDSIAEFAENLFNKVDLLTEDNRRWEPGKNNNATILYTQMEQVLYFQYFFLL